MLCPLLVLFWLLSFLLHLPIVNVMHFATKCCDVGTMKIGDFENIKHYVENYATSFHGECYVICGINLGRLL